MVLAPAMPSSTVNPKRALTVASRQLGDTSVMDMEWVPVDLRVAALYFNWKLRVFSGLSTSKASWVIQEASECGPCVA